MIGRCSEMGLKTVDLLEDKHGRQHLLLKTQESTHIVEISESDLEAVRRRLYKPPTPLTDSPTDDDKSDSPPAT